jgi:MFS family permease
MAETPETEAGRAVGPPRHTFHTLRHRDFGVFTVGSLVSNLGTWAQYIGIGWAARGFTESSLLIGLAFSAQFMPALLLSPVAGVVADRFDRRRLVMAGNLAMMVPALALGVLLQLDVANIGMLIGIVLVGGVAQAFTMPATTAFVPALVPLGELQPAIALNSGLNNATRIVGPGLGALAIKAWGVAGGFYVNAASFLGVVVACSLVRVRPGRPDESPEPFFERLANGFRYARANPAVRWLLLLVAVATFFAMEAPLRPTMAKDVLNGDVSTYAWLSAAPGIGATLGVLVAGEIRADRGRRVALLGAIAAIGGALAVVSVSRAIPLSVAGLGVFGFGHFMIMTLVTTMLMESTVDEYRGRVMGLFSMAAVGSVPLNSVIAGFVASFVGAPVTIALCAGTILTFLAWFVASGHQRHLRTRATELAT